MNTHSHAFFTYTALQGHPEAGLAVLGSVFPDLLFFIACPIRAAATGLNLYDAHRATHESHLLHSLVECCHSFLLLALCSLLAAFAAPWALMFCWGWLSHLCLDFFTHHDSAHPPLFPLSRWKFKSPLSFFEREQHGFAFTVIEHLVIAGILVTWFLQGKLEAGTLLSAFWSWHLPILGIIAALLGLWAIARLPRRWRAGAA